jgi:hypothetical protein
MPCDIQQNNDLNSYAAAKTENGETAKRKHRARNPLRRQGK